jgi:hypothetical protein
MPEPINAYGVMPAIILRLGFFLGCMALAVAA